MGKGNSSNFKTEWDRGFSVPWAFKQDHLQPIKPLLFQYFCNIFTFILGSHFLLPQRANNEKREFSQLQNWMRQRVLSAWAIHPGPLWASWAKIWVKTFDHLDLYTGAPYFLLPPEERKGTDKVQKSKVANSTQCSQAVSHPSTNRAQHCLTSVIGRELVYSMWYGRCRNSRVKSWIITIHEWVRVANSPPAARGSQDAGTRNPYLQYYGINVITLAVSHRNGFRAEYSAESISVKILSFSDERNIRLLPNIRQNHRIFGKIAEIWHLRTDIWPQLSCWWFLIQ